MTKMIFLNLPVTDVARSTAFYEAVGATKNPMFSNETTSCMVFSETIHAMLLSHGRYADFTSRAIPNAHETAQVLICISQDSRADVDKVAEAAAAAGGLPDPTPKQDMGFMYGRSFADPDGHIWELVWMDVAAATGQQPAEAEA